MTTTWDMTHTWDGQAVAQDPPHGCSVAVWRDSPSGPEFLLLHTWYAGSFAEGDWAWGMPAGTRKPGESVIGCAERELFEETGLGGPILEIGLTNDGLWHQFALRLQEDLEIVLSDEHDQWRWVNEGVALQLITPQVAVDGFQECLDFINRQRLLAV